MSMKSRRSLIPIDTSCKRSYARPTVALQLLAGNRHIDLRFIDSRERGRVLVLLVADEECQPTGGGGVGDYPQEEEEDEIVIPMFLRAQAEAEFQSYQTGKPCRLRLRTGALTGPILRFSSNRLIEKAHASFDHGETEVDVELDLETAREWGYLNT